MWISKCYLADLKDIYSKAMLGAGWWRHRDKAVPRGVRRGERRRSKARPEEVADLEGESLHSGLTLLGTHLCKQGDICSRQLPK